MSLFGVALAAMLVGCGSDDSSDANGNGGLSQPVLTGTWTLSQGTVNGTTLPTSLYGTAQLTLNADGTMQVVATPTGGSQVSYAGTYTTSGNTISFTVPGVPPTANVTMPVTATYTFDADSLEIQFDAPITVSGFAISAVFLTR
jgi:hypothetical protein